MWRRTYLLLLLIRVYFALSPSYLHPDENFQGPEVFAGMCPAPQMRCCADVSPTARMRPPTKPGPCLGTATTI